MLSARTGLHRRVASGTGSAERSAFALADPAVSLVPAARRHLAPRRPSAGRGGADRQSHGDLQAFEGGVGGCGGRPITGRGAGPRSVEPRDQVRWYEYGVSRGRGNPAIGRAREPASAAVAVRCRALRVRWFAPGRSGSGPTAARGRGDSSRPPIPASGSDLPPRGGRRVRCCNRKSLHLLNFRHLCGSFGHSAAILKCYVQTVQMLRPTSLDFRRGTTKVQHCWSKLNPPRRRKR